jgi:phospholipid-binding lipoprotein MlaA
MLLKQIFLIILAMATVGCASQGGNKDDPWEGWNRGVYQFNKTIDDAVAKPITLGYQAVTPDIVEKGVSNFFSNIEDVPNMANNLLQGKIGDSFSDLARILVNSTVGIAGFWDPASEMGLPKHDEDFGQTLGAWGVGSGPYVMLPLLGPSTLRDTAAYPANRETDPLETIDHELTFYEAKILGLIDKRAKLIPLEAQLEDVIDEYAFIRDVYLQNRNYKVLDGNIPFDSDCDEDFEEDCDF